MTLSRTLSRIEARLRARHYQSVPVAVRSDRRDGGRVRGAQRAATDDEARAGAERLRGHLAGRGAHTAVISGVRADLLNGDYYEAVFESVKILGHRMRIMTGLELDGLTRRFAWPSPVRRCGEPTRYGHRQERAALPDSLKASSAPSAIRKDHEPRLIREISEQGRIGCARHAVSNPPSVGCER